MEGHNQLWSPAVIIKLAEPIITFIDCTGALVYRY